MREPRPLIPKPMVEVPLPRSPWTHVIAQVRFPPILAIGDPGKVAVIQETLRTTYPYLSDEKAPTEELSSDHVSQVRQHPIWSFSDREVHQQWRAYLGLDFVALETVSEESRMGFLDRLSAVISAVEEAFNPASASRLGLRYIYRLTGAAIDRIDELVRPEVLGITQMIGSVPGSVLRESVVRQMSTALFVAQNGAGVQGHWGELPANVSHAEDVLNPIAERSWIIDLDMFTTQSKPFDNNVLLESAKEFAESQYWIFRQMVTDEFLRFYGGEP